MLSQTLTPSPYVNATNSSMGPLTSSSQATFHSSNAAPTPVNPTTGSGSGSGNGTTVMKGGYTYDKKKLDGAVGYGRRRKSSMRKSSMASSLAMIGGKKRRRTHKKRSMKRKGSRVNKRRTHRRMSGGMSPFPTGYSVGGPLPPGNLTAALAAGGYAVPYYSS